MRERVKPPHETATHCTSLGEKAPTPVGAGGGRGALLAARRRRNSIGVSLLVTFLFAPAVSKRKVAKGAERQYGGCFRATTGRPYKSNFIRIHIEIEKRYSRFFFCPCRPKRKSLAKRKRPRSDFARCDARPRLRALDGRTLAWGLWSALARGNTPIVLRARSRGRQHTVYASSRSRAITPFSLDRGKDFFDEATV